jgi:preprotein translocase subunit SecA
MDNIRLQICTSLFRSATNLIALENMKLMMQRNAVLEGPGTDGGGTGVRPAASAAASRAFARASASVAARQAEAQKQAAAAAPAGVPAGGDGAASGGGGSAAPAPGRLPVVTLKREAAKVGRNDPCPCGSGKKYKHCHGK